jgi:hypothetical protein
MYIFRKNYALEGGFDTSGSVSPPCVEKGWRFWPRDLVGSCLSPLSWPDLTPGVQKHVLALKRTFPVLEHGLLMLDWRFADLAPEALAWIIADRKRFVLFRQGVRPICVGPDGKVYLQAAPRAL